jgi:hypothetical protein
VLIALLLAAHFLVTLPAQTSSLSSEQYWQLVAESKEIVARLEPLPAAAQREELENLAARWAAVEEVIFANGDRVPIDTTLLTTLMRADPPELARLQALFGALESAGDFWPTAAQGAAHGAAQGAAHGAHDLASLRAILARPEFEWPEERPTLWQQWRERLRQAFVELLERLFPEEIRLPGAGLTWTLTLIGAVLLLLVLGYAARALLGNLVTEAAEPADRRGADEALNADLARQQARTFATSGDYRTAVRYLYLSALLLLEERGVLRYDRSLTNREYLRRVAHQPGVAAHLGEIIDLFDRVWYGYQAVDESGYTRYNDQIQALRQAAAQRHTERRSPRGPQYE